MAVKSCPVTPKVTGHPRHGGSPRVRARGGRPGAPYLGTLILNKLQICFSFQNICCKCSSVYFTLIDFALLEFEFQDLNLSGVNGIHFGSFYIFAYFQISFFQPFHIFFPTNLFNLDFIICPTLRLPPSLPIPPPLPIQYPSSQS